MNRTGLYQIHLATLLILLELRVSQAGLPIWLWTVAYSAHALVVLAGGLCDPNLQQVKEDGVGKDKAFLPSIANV